MNDSIVTHNIDRARFHAWFHHQNSDGWITVARKTENGDFRQWHYQPEELAENLTTWIGEDVYFSQNTFFKPIRSIQNVRQLRSLYVDLDFYLFNYDLSWVMGKLEHEHFGETVPEPNIVIFSGQGLVLIWLLDPVPYKALPLWQATQNYLLEELKDLGGDSKAVDAARVFRFDGSVNSKNGAEVRAEYRHDHRYELRQVQFDYLPELNEEINPLPKRKQGRKKKPAQLFNTYRLHHARLLDLVKLVELRNYDVEGKRELICFLYRYWSCCYTSDPSQALDETMSLNLQLTDPLPLKEVERATRSAEKAWEARNSKEANQIAIDKGYPGAGYNLRNSKIIDWLEITSEEMKQLQTVIDGPEKRRRKRERDRLYQEEKRRERGDMTRKQYLEKERDKTMEKVAELKKLLDKGVQRKEIIKRMGISLPYYKKLKKQI